ncbi:MULTISPECIES: hypothetical protein [Actinoalloteichus]|uniref:hypothetical protein n=1 Tax=Actinoalloteichus TaxID=65496 RepID=UPI000A88ACB0|nr:hypothetical protein [Actinoalloteichus caeruleus]
MSVPSWPGSEDDGVHGDALRRGRLAPGVVAPEATTPTLPAFPARPALAGVIPQWTEPAP